MSSNRYIYGIHDHGGEHLLAGRGWVVFTEELGADPSDMAGGNYQRYADQGLGVIVRLNYSHSGKGTLPPRDQYANFARRCANFVAASPGCTTWIIGNEPNHVQEGAISFDDYADGFNQAANAIKRVQPHATVCIAAVAPWNVSAGDWLFYFAQIMRLCHCDGITLHTYTHGSDPNLVYSDEKMQSHPTRFYHFKAYRDFMSAIPADKRHLPVYITETDQDVPWANVNSGWVQNAYAEIDWWNQQPGNQQFRALVLYRWPNLDKWGFCDLAGVHDDTRAAVAKGYQWRDVESPQVLPAPQWTGYITASPYLRLRAEPNTTSNVLANVELGEKVNVIGERAGWLNVVYGALTGWMAKAWVSSNAPVVNDESTEDQRSDRDAIITKLAAEYGVDERVARAVLKIESGGSGYRDGRLVIRFEPHVFKARLNALFDEYFKVGNPAWEGKQHQYNDDGNWRFFHGVQEQEYNALEVALVVARCAAFDSASYGAGQILGLNHETVGYGSAEAMMAAFQNSEEAQLRAMFEFFKNSRGSDGRTAIECLRSGDFLAFAKIYNGNANARHYPL